jgi:hypothetical protein
MMRFQARLSTAGLREDGPERRSLALGPVRFGRAKAIMSVMDRTPQPSRIMLLAGRGPTSPTGTAVVKRYRLARARLDGRTTPLQRSAGDVAASRRSASLSMP